MHCQFYPQNICGFYIYLIGSNYFKYVPHYDDKELIALIYNPVLLF